MRILVVEDDRDTSTYIANGLTEEGHSVDCFADGRDGLLQATAEDYDVMIVDRMLPGLDGLGLVRTLRGAGRHVPVIFLTSLGGVDDRVAGLEVGGDDYVSKPFAFSELLARIHALARRPPLRGEDTVLTVGDLQMDLIKRVVTRRGERIDLQPREFRLLEVLMRNKGRVLTRTMLSSASGISISTRRPASWKRIFHGCAPKSISPTTGNSFRPYAAPAIASMRIDQLYGRTAIRLALAFSVLFVASVLVLFAILYFSLTNSLENRLRQRVLEAQDALARVDRDQGFANLTSVVASEAASVREADSIFLLTDQKSEAVAGNIQQAEKFTGWRILDRAQFPAIQNIGKPDDRFYAMWSPVSQGELLVGANNRVIIETQNTLLRGLFSGVAFAILIPALVGTSLAWRAQRRIDALGSTLSAVAAGHMAERVPISGSRDDLDHVARQINRTLDQLQRLIQSVNETSSDIAHDLKHPIGRLRQRLDVAQSSAQNVAQFREAIQAALTEIDTIVERSRRCCASPRSRRGRARNASRRSILRCCSAMSPMSTGRSSRMKATASTSRWMRAAPPRCRATANC